MPAAGPTTPEGKAVSAHNATRHGLLSTLPVLPHLESQEEWDAHRQQLLENLAPVGATEELLVERIALLFWRLARLARYEVAQATDLRERLDRYDGSPTHRTLGVAASRAAYTALPNTEEFNKLLRYEAHLSRDLHRSFQLLALLQHQRAALPQPPAAPEAPALPEPPPASQPEKTENCETNSPVDQPTGTAGIPAHPIHASKHRADQDRSHPEPASRLLPSVTIGLPMRGGEAVQAEPSNFYGDGCPPSIRKHGGQPAIGHYPPS